MNSNSTIFLGGNVFISDKPVLENASVIIENEKIIKVSKNSNNIPRDAKKNFL